MKVGILALLVFTLASCVKPGMERLTFECDTDYECSQTPPCALKPGCDGGPDSEPYRLVGYDCEGALVPLYYDNEDEFPTCKEIVPTWAID